MTQNINNQVVINGDINNCFGGNNLNLINGLAFGGFSSSASTDKDLPKIDFSGMKIIVHPKPVCSRGNLIRKPPEQQKHRYCPYQTMHKSVSEQSIDVKSHCQSGKAMEEWSRFVRFANQTDKMQQDKGKEKFSKPHEPEQMSPPKAVYKTTCDEAEGCVSQANKNAEELPRYVHFTIPAEKVQWLKGKDRFPTPHEKAKMSPSKAMHTQPCEETVSHMSEKDVKESPGYIKFTIPAEKVQWVKGKDKSFKETKSNTVTCKFSADEEYFSFEEDNLEEDPKHQPDDYDCFDDETLHV